MPDFRDHVLFNQVEARQMVIENLAAAPTTPAPKKGQKYFDTTTNKEGTYNGTGWDYSGSGAVTSVSGSGAIQSTGGNTPTISILPASGATAGSMSITDYVKLSNAASANTASAIVQRDSSGNFAAGTITANLSGTASNASQLGNQAPAFYLARANQTGNQTASTISDFDTQVRTSRLDQMATPTSPVGFGSQRITAVATPTNDADAATKAYVDAAVSTGNNKGTARVASTSNVNISSPGAAIDGVAMALNNIVLLKDQTTGSENGLYVWNGAAVAMTRATNADTSAEVKSGLFVFVSEGTVNGGNGFTLTTNEPIILDTTPLVLSQTSGAGEITAGSGLTKTGNVLTVGQGAGITVNADDVSVDFGTVVRKASALIGDGSATSITVTHSVNNDNPMVTVKSIATNDVVIPSVKPISTTQVTLTFAVAPTANQYRVTIQG